MGENDERPDRTQNQRHYKSIHRPTRVSFSQQLRFLMPFVRPSLLCVPNGKDIIHIKMGMLYVSCHHVRKMLFICMVFYYYELRSVHQTRTHQPSTQGRKNNENKKSMPFFSLNKMVSKQMFGEQMKYLQF